MGRNRFEFSDKFIRIMIDYYSTMKDDEVKLVSEIAEDVEYSEYQIRKFIDAVDNTKGINGEFHPLYRKILLHTVFRKNNIEGSHYMNQQEYLKKRAKVKGIMQIPIEKQDESHTRKGK